MSDSLKSPGLQRQAPPSFTTSRSLLRFMSIESVMLYNLILCCPFLLLPSIFFSIRVLSNELALCIRWPRYWSFSFIIILPMIIQGWFPCSPRDSQESSPTPQSQSINPLVLSLPYGPTLTFIHATRKTIAMTKWTFVSKVITLLFNMLSSFVIAFLPRSKHLLISWLQLPSTVILALNKICHCFNFSPFYSPWSDGTRCHDLWFLNVEF